MLISQIRSVINPQHKIDIFITKKNVAKQILKKSRESTSDSILKNMKT